MFQVGMKSIVWISLLLTILLVGLFAAAARRAVVEGFTATVPAPQQADIDIGRTLELLQKLGGFVLNPSNWKERFDLMGKSPVELARLHLAAQAKSLTTS